LLRGRLKKEAEKSGGENLGWTRIFLPGVWRAALCCRLFVYSLQVIGRERKKKRTTDKHG